LEPSANIKENKLKSSKMNEPIFETEEDLKRELKAMNHFASLFNFQFKKLPQFEIDFEVLKNDKLIAYAEIKGRSRNIQDGDYFIVAIRKIAKMIKKKNEQLIIWACPDGIVFGKLFEITGGIEFGGRKQERENATNDKELMAHYHRQEKLFYSYYDDKKFYPIELPNNKKN
jgi:hypothetical protein